jgi:filamentous hemagglutinin family protein
LVGGGARRGAALFHSFSEFNLNLGQRVYFANPIGVQNILSRVTGANPSQILGTLGVDGAANLFLLNPQGILFGAEARLDVAGSLVASTASSLKLTDGSEFSATSPQPVPLLTLGITPGLQWGASRSGATITNRSGLQVGGDLTLIADRLDLQGSLQSGGHLSLQAQDTVKIRDTITTPFLAQAGGHLTIQGHQGIDILAINHAGTPFQSRGDLSLVSDGRIATDAHFQAGGNFAIRTLAGIPANFVSLTDPIVTAGGDYTVGDYTGASLQVTAGQTITYGTVVIDSIDPNVHPTQPALLMTAGGEIRGLGDVSTTVATGNLIVDFQSQGSIAVNRIITQGGPITLNSQQGEIITARDPSLPIGGDLDSTSSQGNGGEIRLTARGNITAGRVYSYSDTFFQGQGGPISLHSTEGNIDTFHVFSYSFTRSGGDIRFTAPQGRIQAWGFLGFALSDPTTPSQAGAVTLAAQGNVDITQDGINTFSLVGNGGAVAVTSQRGNLTIKGDIVSQSSQSDAGAVTLTTAGGNINTTGGGIFASAGRSGRGGAVTLAAQGGSLTVGETNVYSTEGVGGTIDLFATGNLVTNSLNTTAKLGSGSIRITTEAEFSTSFRERVDSDGVTQFSSVISSDTFGTGRGGDIQITARSIALRDGDQISASTHASGAGGNIVLRATEAIDLRGTIPSGVNPGPYSRAGLSRSEEGKYFGGYVPTGVTSPFKSTNLNNGQFPTGVFTQATADATGAAGNITIATGRLTVQDRAAIAATTFGQNNAGTIQITANQIDLATGGAILSGVAPASPGNSGQIAIATETLRLDSGSSIQTRTLGRGDAGAIDLNASRSVELSGANTVIRSSSGGESTAINQMGAAGDIRIRTVNLELREGATLSAETFSTQKGGSIGITAPTVLLDNGAKIAVTSQGTGAAGEIQIMGNRLTLRDRSLISAETATSQGGNINLQLAQFLVMRRGSLISATAGIDLANGAGGNITIAAPFLLSHPFENNDISANAFSDQGGRIAITAPLGIYWLEFRSRADLERLLNTTDQTQLSPRKLRTNDITAFSQASSVLAGEVILNESRPTISIPIDWVDSSRLLVQRCGSSSRQTSSSFVITGKGGLPPSPNQVLRGETVTARLATLTPAAAVVNTKGLVRPAIVPPPVAIVEAQGLQITAEGELSLVADPATASPLPQSSGSLCP